MTSCTHDVIEQTDVCIAEHIITNVVIIMRHHKQQQQHIYFTDNRDVFRTFISTRISQLLT